MSRNKRDRPADFAEVSAAMSIRAMRWHYVAGEHTIIRWLGEIGKTRAGPPRSQPVPADFAELAAKYHAEHLKRHYDVSGNVIERWSRISGIKPVSGVKRAPPADFASVAPYMTRSALKEHYRADIRTVTRWCEETGVSARQPVQNIPPPSARRRSYNPSPSMGRGFHISATRTGTIHDEAAAVIQKYMPAYRCDERGRGNFKGEFWRVGVNICTPDELLERADRYRSRAA